MNPWLSFLIGLWLGASAGVVIAGLLAAARDADRWGQHLGDAPPPRGYTFFDQDALEDAANVSIRKVRRS